MPPLSHVETNKVYPQYKRLISRQILKLGNQISGMKSLYIQKTI